MINCRLLHVHSDDVHFLTSCNLFPAFPRMIYQLTDILHTVIYICLNQLGTSPLHLAAQHGHTQTAEVLLRAGVSRDARTKVSHGTIIILKSLVLSTGLIMRVGHRKEFWNLSSFRISLWWPIHIINPVDKTKLSPQTQHNSFFRNLLSLFMIMTQFVISYFAFRKQWNRILVTIKLH